MYTALLQLNSLPQLALVGLLIVAFLCLVVVVIEYFESKKILDEIRKNSLEAASEKGMNLIRNALKKAQQIIFRAELEGVKVASESRLDSKKWEEKYQAQFNSFLEDLEKRFSEAAQKANTDFSASLNSLTEVAQKSAQESQDHLKTQVSSLLSDFETKLSEFLSQAQTQSTQSIELELKAARSLIDSYKTQQLNLIDENVVAMLEKTLSMVISKKLTLRDQLDLVYEALEKAKVEKFIV